MRRLLTFAVIPVAAAIGSTALAVGLSGTAWAAGVNPTPGSSVACTGVKYDNTNGSATVSKCYTTGPTSTGKVYKELVASSAATLLGGGTIPWSPGPSGGASITTSSLTPATATGTCSKKDTNAAYSGTITGATGTGDPVQNGDAVYIDVCISTNAKTGDIKVSVAKGTAVEF